jgi:hypothetical protein
MKPYRTNLRDVPHVAGLKPKDGWINMQVQFLIDQKTANSDKLVLGWTVLPPGARHDAHRHFHADEFLLVIKEAVRSIPMKATSLRVKAMLSSPNEGTGMVSTTQPMTR